MKLARQRTAVLQEPIGYVFIAPFYAFLTVFVIIPIIANLALSFSFYDLSSIRFVGFGNFLALPEDPFFLAALKNTVEYTGWTLSLSMLLGLLAAVALNESTRSVKVFRVFIFIPHVMSMVSVSMIWLWLYEPSNGMFNTVLSGLGLPKLNWLYDVRLAMTSIIFMSVWKAIGYNMVVFLAGLQAVPAALYEAARIDGAGRLRQLVSITLPMLRPITFFLFVTGMINNFNVFEQVRVLTNGGPMSSTTTLVHQIYDRAFNTFSLGYAAAITVVLLVIVAGLTFLNLRIGNQGADLDA